MSATISTADLARTLKEPITKLTTWANRGFIASETPRRWTFAEAIAVGMFAQAMRSVKTAADASARAVGMSGEVGKLLNEAVAGAPPEAWERLIFVTATFPDGEVKDNSVRTVTEAAICAGERLLHGAVHVEVIDASDVFRTVCAAFVAAQAKAERKANAKAEVTA